MTLVSSVGSGLKTLLVGGVAFVVGLFAWAALSGLLGAVLDSVGLVIPADVYLAAGPVLATILASYAVSEVS